MGKRCSFCYWIQFGLRGASFTIWVLRPPKTKPESRREPPKEPRAMQNRHTCRKCVLASAGGEEKFPRASLKSCWHFFVCLSVCVCVCCVGSALCVCVRVGVVWLMCIIRERGQEVRKGCKSCARARAYWRWLVLNGWNVCRGGRLADRRILEQSFVQNWMRNEIVTNSKSTNLGRTAIFFPVVFPSPKSL